MMAALAKYIDDNSGSITTAGSSTAYTVTSNQVFDSLSNMSGQSIRVKMHVANGAAPTLNVDGLGAKPINISSSIAVALGALVLNGTYTVTYLNASSEFLLQDQLGVSAFMPAGSVLPYAGSTEPTGFLFCYGQAVSRTTYAILFAAISTTYGIGDGSTTFNLPDIRGRFAAGQDDMGGSSANRLTGLTNGVDGDVLGGTGGLESTTIVTANLPPYTPTGTIGSDTLTMPTRSITSTTGTVPTITNAANQTTGNQDIISTFSGSATSTFTGAAQGGVSTAMNNVPPTIILNYIIKY